MKKHKKIVLAFTSVLVVVALATTALELSDTTNFFGDSGPKNKNTDYPSKTTSKAPSAQSDFSEGDPNKEPGNSLNENRGSALIEEADGEIVKNGNPIASSTGEITAYSPNKNSTVKSGAVLSGTSTLSAIEYRITDSISGVIATGSLPVNNGKFSGKISFDTNAPDGRIELFATRSDFSEYSYIEIPIKFKN